MSRTRTQVAQRSTRQIALTTLALIAAVACAEEPPLATLPEDALREYAGVYQWGPDAFVYLQLWNELSGRNELVAFDESGEVRTLIHGHPDPGERHGS